MKSRLPIAAFLAACCALAAAQTTVYESKDKAGPVFSDQPSFSDQPTKAKPIVVPPMNQSQGVAPQAPAPAPAAAAPYYTAISIADPGNEGTIHSNTGAFDVRVQIAPALRSAAGDRIKIKLDGKLLATRFQSARLRVAAADWNAAANPDNVAHTLQVSIVDRNGAVLLESAAVTFYAHRAAVGGTKR